MSKNWIQTKSGQKFFPLDPRVEDVDVQDIAHALSNICRYTGHCSRFYSVAEHSYWVSLRVENLTGSKQAALWGLLHDASEAYLTDIARPVKQQPEFQLYRVAEKKLQRVICNRFWLSHEEPVAVKQADLELLCTEAEQLMQPLHPEWVATMSGGWCPLPGHASLGMLPLTAKQAFLTRFNVLTGGWYGK